LVAVLDELEQIFRSNLQMGGFGQEASTRWERIFNRSFRASGEPLSEM
jgi:hypothetical protein